MVCLLVVYSQRFAVPNAGVCLAYNEIFETAVMGKQSCHGIAQFIQVISFVSTWSLKILSLNHMKNKGGKHAFLSNNLQRALYCRLVMKSLVTTKFFY